MAIFGRFHSGDAKNCLGFHQFEAIALMPCFAMNLLLKECGVNIIVTNKNS